MKGHRTMLLAVLVVAGAIGVPLAASQARTADAEHARLTAMAGTWEVAMTLWPRPGGTAIPATGTSTIRPILDGLFIEEKIEASLSGTAVSTLAWTGFNSATHQYEATRISSTSPGRIAETGGYDDKTGQFELKADYQLGRDTWHQRTVIETGSPDAMIATSYLSFGTVPEWKAVEIKYTRKPR